MLRHGQRRKVLKPLYAEELLNITAAYHATCGRVLLNQFGVKLRPARSISNEQT